MIQRSYLQVTKRWPMALGCMMFATQASFSFCADDSTEDFVEREAHQIPPASSAESTREWIDFQTPSDAQQLIGPDGSLLIPENPKIASQWKFAEGVLTASPKWDSVMTPESYEDFVMHIEFNVNEAGDVEIGRAHV